MDCAFVLRLGFWYALMDYAFVLGLGFWNLKRGLCGLAKDFLFFCKDCRPFFVLWRGV